MRKNVWFTEIALRKHYLSLTNYSRVLGRERIKAKGNLEYYIDKQLLVTELLIGVVKKIMSSNQTIESTFKEHFNISYYKLNGYLKNGRLPKDDELYKLAKYINS